MSDEISGLLLALGIFALGFLSVGPNILAIVGTSMRSGRAAGVRLATGIGLGAGLWATLTITGMTALVAAYAHAMTVLKIIGVMYLFWLAFCAFRNATKTDSQLSPIALRSRNYLRLGLLIQMTNPKAALLWVMIAGSGLGTDPALWVCITLIVCGTAFSILGHMAYAVTFSLQPVKNFYQRSRRKIECGLGVFFSAAAIKLATDRG